MDLMLFESESEQINNIQRELKCTPIAHNMVLNTYVQFTLNIRESANLYNGVGNHLMALFSTNCEQSK